MASVVAILVVRRSHMFPIVIAPPIVYSAAALFQLYLRSGGLHDKKVVLDAAANYLVYGFPAIAAATAAVLIIAGIRLIAAQVARRGRSARGRRSSRRSSCGSANASRSSVWLTSSTSP